MPRRKRLEASDLLGPLEARVMEVIWRHPDISGVEATEMINADRPSPLSHRTILTILSRLEAKGYLQHRVDGRTYRYSAVVEEDRLVERHAQHAVAALLERYGDEAVIAGIVHSRDEETALSRLEAAIERLRER